MGQVNNKENRIDMMNIMDARIAIHVIAAEDSTRNGFDTTNEFILNINIIYECGFNHLQMWMYLVITSCAYTNGLSRI